nr:MAG: putative capsid protein [Circoviridae sp.]
MTPKRVLFVSPSPRKRARAAVRVVKKRRVKVMRRSSKKKSTMKSRLRLSGMTSFGRPEAKQVLTLDQEVTNLSTRTWGAVNLMQVPITAAGGNMNSRAGREAHVSGILHKVTWRNLTETLLKVYEFWIIPLQYDSTTINDAALQDDFFTVHGQANDNDRAWTAVLASQLYDEPINSNKFIVVKKRVTKLAPSTGSAVSAYGTLSCMKSFKSYIPINRKYTYGHVGDGESAVNTLQPPVFYITFTIDQLTASSTAVRAAACQREIHMVTYFRDGESGMK